MSVNADPSERKPRKPKLWELTTTGIIIVCFVIFAARIADHYMRASNRMIADAQNTARIAIKEKTEAKEEAATAKAEVEKVVQQVDRIASAYETEPEGAPIQKSRRGYVYLGICRDHWVKPYFSDLPPCAEGPLKDPVVITSLRGVMLRSSPPAQAGVGHAVNRIKDRGKVRLLGIVSISPADPDALPIYWGEVEIPNREDLQALQSPTHDP